VTAVPPSPPASLILPDRRILSVSDLSVRFTTSERSVEAVRHLSFHVEAGETLAIVGESGSGKSVTSLALMRLVEHGGGKLAAGRLLFRRRSGAILDLATASNAEMRDMRGAESRSRNRSGCTRARGTRRPARKPCGCSTSCASRRPATS
jgi:energy-coupling factor transporter ATP-binding protein EcfA2